MSASPERAAAAAAATAGPHAQRGSLAFGLPPALVERAGGKNSSRRGREVSGVSSSFSSSFPLAVGY